MAHAQQTPQEKQLFEQLNGSRREAGRDPLGWDERLAQAARQHTRHMIEANKLGHVVDGEAPVPERLATTGIRFNRSGENVGYNTDFADLHRAWMESPGHRENILNPNYNVVGIGVAQGEDGLFYATQDFAHALPQRTAEQAEELAADAFDNLRKQAKRNPLEHVKNARVEELACSMAKSGKLNPRQASTLPYVRTAVVYNNSRSEELPESARKLARQTDLTKYSVGACFTTDQPSNPGGTFYVVMAFY
ncbi:MAG: CAP domain-containing protein [Terriglobales bacterium]